MYNRGFGVLMCLILCLTLAACPENYSSEGKSGFAPGSRTASGSALEGATRSFTAKAVVAKAQEKARAWQSDARLMQAETDYADPQGKIQVSADPNLAGVTRWEFIFSSAKTKGALRVLTDGGQYLEARDATKEQQSFDPIPEDFVDSDLAMAESKKNGYPPSADGNAMCLARAYVFISSGSTPEKFAEPVWIVGTPGDQFIVSAKTGKFLSKHK